MRYRYLNTTKRSLLLLISLSGVWFSGFLMAQVIQLPEARTDNFFAYPGIAQYLNVLKNDDYGECSQSTVNLSLPVMKTPKGMAVVVPTTNRIYYQPDAGVIHGQDAFSYQIECGGHVSNAMVYVNICEQPSFMEIDKCFTPRPATIWDIEKKAQSQVQVHPLATPFVGDLDGDGKPEIVVPNYLAAGSSSYANGSDTILILDNNLELKTKFFTPLLPTYPTMPLLIADVDNDGQGEIVVFTSYNNGGEDMYRLICYTESGIRKWTSDVPVFNTDQRTNNTASSDASPSLVIADMNGDGYPEVLVYDKIFAAESGKLLVTLPDGGKGMGIIGSAPTYMPVLADVNNDGILDVVAGNTTYSITITNREGTAGNTAAILAQINQPDGFTFVADIDGDGSLDVIVTNSSPVRMYVWDGATSALIGTVQQPDTKSRVSRAFVGDITGNGVPDIAFTYINGMIAYAYDRATDTFSQLWQKPTTDGSGSTTMSMFDFDQNGEAELIYRDETHLRIIDKDGNNIVEIDCFSGTHSEYPVLVDLDGSGHADILVSGANPGGSISSEVYIMRYGSITPNQWAACGRVWNQHGFNPLYIRDDLSVVRYPLNPATAFYDSGNGQVNYPFNNFLQQATTFNQEGEPLHYGPNLYFESSHQSLLELDDTDKMTITIHVNNDGDASYTGNLRISTYVYDTSVDPAMEYKLASHNVAVDILPINIDPDPTTITYEITGFSLVEPPQYDRWEIRLNWEDNTYPIDLEECKYSDNINNNLGMVRAERVMCEGETETVYAYPENTYWYIWYDDLTGGTKIGEGDFCELSKNSSPTQDYYIEIWDLSTKSHRLSAVREKVTLYLAPDSLEWTGFGNNSNWHDHQNWKNPVPLHTYEAAYIPRACTNVLIPSYIENYPDLSTGTTNYDTYPVAACNNITFAHGGELVRQDLLDYQRAYVDLELLSNRWYMVSSPLQHTYPGDYYVNDKNPVQDDVFVYTRLFSRHNPQTGYYLSGNWTGSFNTPNFLLGNGLGFSVWVDDKEDDPTQHLPFTFHFPKYDRYYYIHDEEGNEVTYYPFDRTNHHRFIYEPDLMSGSISLAASATLSGEAVIVGNPFMAQLDFDSFHAMNSSLIADYYQVLDGNGVFVSYQKGVTPVMGEPDRYIAPMQSVLVTSVSPFDHLYVRPEMSATSPGNRLRSAIDKDASEELLSIRLEKDGQFNRSHLVHYPSGLSDASLRNVPQAFLESVTSPVAVYFVLAGEALFDICHVNDLSQPITLGLRTTSTGQLELRFEGLRAFAAEYDIYLTDLYGDTPRQIDLRVFPYYRFEKEKEDLFVNDRFYLSFVKRTPSLVEDVKEDNEGIAMFNTDEGIRVVSVDGSSLKDIRIYDLQGRLLYTLSCQETYDQAVMLPLGGIYLVRADNGNRVRTMKFYRR